MSGEEINAQITAVGEEIRQLKASKADKATIDGKVATDPIVFLRACTLVPVSA
jgi:uncharacterized small protein (DUF1192 family)